MWLVDNWFVVFDSVDGVLLKHAVWISLDILLHSNQTPSCDIILLQFYNCLVGVLELNSKCSIVSKLCPKRVFHFRNVVVCIRIVKYRAQDRRLCETPARTFFVETRRSSSLILNFLSYRKEWMVLFRPFENSIWHMLRVRCHILSKALEMSK